FVTLLRDGREGSTPHEVSNRCGRALTNVRSTSTPAVRRVGARFYAPQRWIDGRELEQADQCKRRTPFVEGSNRQKFGRSAHTGRAFGSARSSSSPRRWWPLDGAVRGQVGGIHCGLSCSSLRRHGTGVSDCVLGSTASGSNPSRS